MAATFTVHGSEPRVSIEPLFIDGARLAPRRGGRVVDADSWQTKLMADQVDGVRLESRAICLTGLGADQRMTMRTLHSSS